MKLRNWIHGLVSAFIGGAASSVSASIVAPNEFNLTVEGLKRIGILMLVSGIVTACAYLKQSPIPVVNGDTTIETKKP